MKGEEKRWIGILPLFDPEEGKTILEPPGSGPGSWVGGESIIFDTELNRFYLYYRLRNPRQGGDPKERGFECRIAESSDGFHFRDIWSSTKQDYKAASLERGALVKSLEGKYRLYISFEDTLIGKWKIDMLEAGSPREFDPEKRVKVLEPLDKFVGHVKDPYVMVVGRLYHMFVSYHPAGWQSSYTGLALSADGVNFLWQGDIFPHGTGWDTGISRITSVLYIPPLFHVFYDGGENMRSSCEEKAGLAISFDLRSYQRVSQNGPLFASPYGSGSLRYVDTIMVNDYIYYYYEYARKDGSHELRMNKVKRPSSW